MWVPPQLLLTLLEPSLLCCKALLRLSTSYLQRNMPLALCGFGVEMSILQKTLKRGGTHEIDMKRLHSCW